MVLPQGGTPILKYNLQFTDIAPACITPDGTHVIDKVLPWGDTHGAIPSGAKAQSAVGTPPTADYHGKKNIYICVHDYNSLSMDICAGAK